MYFLQPPLSYRVARDSSLLSIKGVSSRNGGNEKRSSCDALSDDNLASLFFRRLRDDIANGPFPGVAAAPRPGNP
jgi:hypothetical protein